MLLMYNIPKNPMHCNKFNPMKNGIDGKLFSYDWVVQDYKSCEQILHLTVFFLPFSIHSAFTILLI